ncbi:MAG: bifunctional riboflavin kinase/FAD synthetase [Rhodospirillaceae bacterium]|jgi:riboflavin kinase/FMN adenylyltransferase|nr:bifunctional riboflavin kinase/FAD synthetase [Rhodospirillaceae bacterium]MBT5659000.1 bifunctional riboflavin kinase/FAD synthetase [Rhodospirillaceae bacterium]MBT5752122.1 bifunctional riboflavin kinase/FAD synthetase [Rhodospirillaceae bacterium]
MRIFRHFTDLPPKARHCVVALGNFDGVHHGHQHVIRTAGSIAHDLGAPHTVMTFEPHPRLLFNPDHPPFRLTSLRTKAHCIESLGVDSLFVLHFDRAFSSLSAEDFISQILCDALAVRHVVTGYDFVFGHGRKGNPDLLFRMATEKGFGFTCVDKSVDPNGEAYASTIIRTYLENGNPARAAELLGRPWEIEGRVVKGDQRGGELGFPTANVHFDDYLVPAFGVYAVRAGIDHGAGTHWHDGVANLGIRPTFGGDKAVLEVHLFDFEGNLYGQHLRVAMMDYLRPEKKFDGIEGLKAQIAVDAGLAKDLLANMPPPHADGDMLPPSAGQGDEKE